MRINHEHEAIKDFAEELHYEGYHSDDIYYMIDSKYDISGDVIEQLLIEVEHRVNDVPNDGFIIEGDENLYSN